MPRAPHRDPADVDALLAGKGLPLTDFVGWDRLDAHERESGAAQGRERLKVHARADMTRIAARAPDATTRRGPRLSTAAASA